MFKKKTISHSTVFHPYKYAYVVFFVLFSRVTLESTFMRLSRKSPTLWTAAALTALSLIRY